MLLKEDLRDIIENGENERLRQLLAGERAEALLTRKYGGRAGEGGADASGLYSGTLPLLHAAIRGQEVTFGVISDALQVI